MIKRINLSKIKIRERIFWLKVKYIFIAFVSAIAFTSISLGLFTPNPAVAQVSSLNLQFTPAIVNPGEVSRVSITLFNSAISQALTNSALTNNLPPGMTVANPPNSSTTCGGTINATPGANSFNLAGGTVPAKVGFIDGRCTFAVDVVTTVQGNSINTILASTFTNTQGETNATPASTTLQVRAMNNPSLSKILAPSTIYINDQSTLTITVNNTDLNIDLHQVSLTDNLPTNLTIAASPLPSTTCSGGSVAITATSVNLSQATIPKNSSCTITVPVTSSTSGSYTNTIPVNNLSSQEGVSNASPATAPLTIQTRSVSVSKAFLPANPYLGDNSVLTITLNNPTFNSSYTNLALTDNLPTNVQVTNPPPTTTCGSGSVSNTVTSLSLTGGTLAAQFSCSITANVKAVGTATTAAARTNTIAANSITTAQSTTNATFTTNITPITRTVTVAKAVSASSLPINANATFTITLTNPTKATTYNNLSFTDNLALVAPGLTVSSPPTTTCGGSVSSTPTTVSLTGGILAPLGVPAPPGGNTGSCTVTFGATATTAGTYTNRIASSSVNTTEGATNSGNTDRNVIFTNLSLTVAKAFSPSPVNINADSNLTITITNPTTTNITGINLTDNFPSGLTIKTGTTPSTTCGGSITNTSSSVKLTGGSILGGQISPNDRCTITAIVISTGGSVYTNTINPGDVSSTQGATIGGSVSTNVTVRSLDLAKSFSPASVAVGTPSTMTIVLTNRSGANLTNLTATDNLPTGLVVATPPAPTLCGGGTVTRVDGSALTGGESSLKVTRATALATGSNCTVSVKVTPTSTGQKVNTINLGDVTNTQNIVPTQPAQAILTGTSANITVSKSFLPSTVSVGSPSTLSILINNPNNTSNLTGLAFTDTLPTGLVIATPVTTSTTCTAGSVTATAGGSSVSLSGATLSQGGNCKVDVNVAAKSFGTGTYTNTIPVNAITTTQLRTNDTATTASLNITGASVSKTFFPTKIAPGGRSTLTVTLTNLNNAPLTGVQVTDNLLQTPAAQKITVAGAPTNASTTCAGGTVAATPGGTSFSLSGATVPAAVAGVPGLCTFQVDVTGTASSLSHTNTIPVNSLIDNEGISNPAPATAVLTFLPLNINVGKTFSPLTVSGGSTSNLTITLSNPTTENYLGVQFTDNMPSGMIVAAPANATTTCTDGTVTAIPNSNIFSLAGGKIPANSSCQVTLKVTSIQPGNLTNTINVNDVTTFQGAKNTVIATATLTNLPGVGVGKSFAPNIIEPNQVSRLTITAINARDNGLTNLAFTDQMPTGLIFAAVPNISTTCNGVVNATNTPTAQLSLTGGSLGVRAACTVSVNVTANSVGNYLNDIPPGTITNTQGSTNPEPASDTLIVTILPTVSKSFSPVKIPVNGVSTLSIQLGNNAASNITLTNDLIDTFPPGIVVATTPNLAGTCTAANIIANPSSGNITYTSGAIIPVGGCTMRLNVTTTVPGSYINTIPIGALRTNNGDNLQPATATLTSGNANILLVKRITAVNGATGTSTAIGGDLIAGYTNDSTNPYDDNTLDTPAPTPPDTQYWPTPNTFLVGAINGGQIKPNDIVEYTIYFLSTGDTEAQNVLFCDRVPSNATFIPTAFNSLPTPNPTTRDRGIAVDIGGTLNAYTNSADSDFAEYFPPGVEPSNKPGYSKISCGKDSSNQPLPNSNGAVVVNLGNIPNATSLGQPPSSHGFVRFRALVK
jgi:uncharacterized repeat protein (TIGR01451 family)/fimbrial isopeptide formation D2 family protein